MKKFLCILLCVVLFTPTVAVFAETSESTALDMSFFGSDESRSSYYYNHALCRTAASLSAAAGSSYSINRRLSDMGFSNVFRSVEYNGSDYNEDGIRFAFASKRFNDGSGECSLIAVALGGTDHEEWIGNMSLDGSQTHRSFDIASEEVLGQLAVYLENLGDTGKLKFLIFGHSRGAAVSNLVGAKLGDSGQFAQRRDIYTYTFATPNVTFSPAVDDTKYHNIFNIVNPEDFVTYSPLSQWGYSTYGITLRLPTNIGADKKLSEHSEAVLAEFEAMSGFSYDYFDNGSRDTVNMINCVNYASECSVEGFLTKKYDLSDFLPPFIADKYSLHAEMTVAELFLLAGRVLAGAMDYSSVSSQLLLLFFHPAFSGIAKYFATGLFSPDEVKKILTDFFALYPELSDFITLEELEPLIDITMSRRLFCAHMPEAYIAWLNVIDANELTDESVEVLTDEGAVRITTASGAPIGNLLACFVPTYGVYSASSVKLGYATQLENISRVWWTSSSIFIGVSNEGEVGSRVEFGTFATVTLYVLCDDGKIYKDRIKVVYYRSNRQLDIYASDAYDGHYELFSAAQRTLLTTLILGKGLNVLGYYIEVIRDGVKALLST